MKKIKQNLSEHIEGILRKRIMLLELTEGEHLKENQLAEEFNISRGPVREAITKLELEGLVTRESNGRALVSKFDIQYITNLYDVRILLEKFAIQSFSRDLDQSDIEKLQYYVQEMKTYKHLDIERYREADINFHYQLVKMSKNKPLIQAWVVLKQQLLTLIEVTTFASHDRSDEIIDEHEAVAIAMLNDDLQAASERLEKHLKSALAYYQDVVFRLQNKEV